MTTAAPFLMFQGRCEEALTFYAAALPDTRVTDMRRGDDGKVAMARLSVAGLEVMANDSPPVHAFDFTPSNSIFVALDDPADVDRLAAAIAADGGKVHMPPDDYGFSRRFAWVQDRFGPSWQFSAA